MKLAWVLAVLAAQPVIAGAQTLGEVAAREAKKKVERTPAAGVPAYTDEDLKSATGELTILGEEPPDYDEADPDAEAVEASERDVERRSWSDRAEEKRRAIREGEQQVESVKARIETLRQDLNPMANVTDPFRLQTIQAALNEATAELQAAEAALVQAREALADLEEEARRSGVPPGWLQTP